MKNNFVNLINEKITGEDFHTYAKTITIHELKGDNYYIEDLISENEVKQFKGILDGVEWTPVSYTGMKGNYKCGDSIGSYRASIYDEKYAQLLWERIKFLLPKERELDEYSHTDGGGHNKWRPTGVSPLFRVIKYTDGGKLVVHYDSSFIESDEKRTLQSLVLYICHENIEGGATRFIKDEQSTLKFTDRTKDDQNRFAVEEEVIYKPLNNSGGAIVFDHNNLHDGEEVSGSGVKIIIRTDIFYEKVYS